MKGTGSDARDSFTIKGRIVAVCNGEGIDLGLRLSSYGGNGVRVEDADGSISNWDCGVS